MKFGFVAKHRGAWPVNLMCEALGVSRGGFYAWLACPRSRRSLDDEKLGAQVHQSFVRSDRTWPHAQIISYPREPGANKYLFSMWAFREAGFFDILEEYCNFCLAYEKATGYRCDLPSVGYAIGRDVEALLSYSWEGATLSIDPASTGGPEWEEFLHHYNEFCSARRGVPLFNQTPFLTRDQVRKAFGVRIQQFAARRKVADPKNRMLDSYFRDLLS